MPLNHLFPIQLIEMGHTLTISHELCLLNSLLSQNCISKLCNLKIHKIWSNAKDPKWIEISTILLNFSNYNLWSLWLTSFYFESSILFSQTYSHIFYILTEKHPYALLKCSVQNLFHCEDNYSLENEFELPPTLFPCAIWLAWSEVPIGRYE
jgi:hypothetical protein